MGVKAPWSKGKSGHDVDHYSEILRVHRNVDNRRPPYLNY